MKKLFSKPIPNILFLLLLAFCCSAQTIPAQTLKSSNAVKLNERLAKGWNTWNTRSVLSQVLLPECFAVNLKLQDEMSGSILSEALIGRRGADVENVIPGPHSYDGSYTELAVQWKNIVVNVKTAAAGNNLALVITPEKINTPANLLINPKVIWGKEGNIKISKSGFSISNNNKTVKFYLTSDRGKYVTDSTIVCPLNGKIILSTYKDKSSGEIETLINSAKDKLVETKKHYGADSSLYDAMQTVLAWDIIYEPVKQNVISPVSRIWNCNWNGWVLFDWDTYFAAYMYSLDNKDLAYANAIAISKEITKNGFIPNFGSALGKSEDRSEPPVGSFIVWKIYEKYKEKWFLSEVFNELLSWNRWWGNSRDINGYLCWGSDPYNSEGMPGWLTQEIGKRQAAMWESGLDNSPMFDNVVFDSTSHRLMLADAGLISMYICDCQYLTKIAKELGKNDIKKELEKRIQKYTKSLESLYDEKSGMYLNRDLVTGKLSSRLSPTLFYPLLTGVPSQQQAERIIQEHFYNPKEFWGDWIMPSISRNDSAFKDNTYWRGRIWAPMNFLVYCGLKNYNLPQAKTDLTDKSKKLIMKSWLEEHHVYENYNSVTGTGSDVENSDKFYHWGALLAFIKLMEN